MSRVRKGRLGLALALLVTASGASAQLAGLLGQSLGVYRSGEAGGSYRSKNQVRVYISADPDVRAASLYGKLIVKASDMAAATGYGRIGVTKSDCSQLLTNGVPRSMACFLVATMLNDGETATPRGDAPVAYFDVAAVHADAAPAPMQTGAQ